MNTSIISDHLFDTWSKELAQLQRDYPEQARQCVYAEEFANFDGSSGFDLPTHYPEVVALATYILRIHKKRTEAVE
jgi:NAD-dependent DNA ligase